MKRWARALTAATVVGGLVGVIGASPAGAALVNGGFETPDIDPNAFVVGPPANWGLTPPVQGGNVVILNSPTFAVSQGEQALNLSGTSPNAGPATSGGVQQIFSAPIGVQHTVSYDWTSKCAGSNVRVWVDGLIRDQATNPTATYPTYSTRTFTYVTPSDVTTIRFDTTTPGPTGASGQICGTIIDNIRFTAATGITPTAAPASQCTGATGHQVQFRKVNFALTSNAGADSAYARNIADPAVLRQASDDGVDTIHYSDNGFAVPSQPALGALRDVNEPPLNPQSGPAAFTAGNDTNFVVRSSGYISIPTAGAWTFWVHGDDGFRLWMGQPAVLVAQNSSSSPDSTTFTVVNIPAAGCYHYALQHFNELGPSSVSFSAAPPLGGSPILVGNTAAGGLAVFQGSDSPIDCKIVAVRPAPSPVSFTNDTMDVRVTELDGIGGIYNVQATNATVQPFPLGFAAGTTGPILVRATKITQGQPAAFSFTVSDWNGNTKTCT